MARRPETIVDELMGELVEIHRAVHAAQGHDGDVRACMAKIATRARTSALAHRGRTRPVSFERFLTMVLKQAASGGTSVRPPR